MYVNKFIKFGEIFSILSQNEQNESLVSKQELNAFIVKKILIFQSIIKLHTEGEMTLSDKNISQILQESFSTIVKHLRPCFASFFYKFLNSIDKSLLLSESESLNQLFNNIESNVNFCSLKLFLNRILNSNNVDTSDLSITEDDDSIQGESEKEHAQDDKSDSISADNKSSDDNKEGQCSMIESFFPNISEMSSILTVIS